MQKNYKQIFCFILIIPFLSAGCSIEIEDEEEVIKTEQSLFEECQNLQDLLKEENYTSLNLMNKEGLNIIDAGQAVFMNNSDPQKAYYYSDEFGIEMSDNLISFELHLFSDSDSTIGFCSLKDPSGNELLYSKSLEEYKSLSLRPFLSIKYNNLLIPNSAKIEAIPGLWRFRVLSAKNEVVKVKYSIRTGVLDKSSELTIQPFIANNTYYLSNINKALDLIENIFERNNLNIKINEPVYLNDSRFFEVSSDFTDSDTSNLIKQGFADTVNLFFVEDLIGEDSNTLGITAALPGSQGIVSEYNGVLVNLAAHKTRKKLLNWQLLGETSAHEIGHLLGLHHTTESDGMFFDPLDDTPKCTVENDINSDGTLTTKECLDFDASNLMFWAGDTSITQYNLSSEQVNIIRFSLLAK